MQQTRTDHPDSIGTPLAIAIEETAGEVAKSPFEGEMQGSYQADVTGIVCEGVRRQRGNAGVTPTPVDLLCKRSVVFRRSDEVFSTRISARMLLVHSGSGAIRTRVAAGIHPVPLNAR